MNVNVETKNPCVALAMNAATIMHHQLARSYACEQETTMEGQEALAKRRHREVCDQLYSVISDESMFVPTDGVERLLRCFGISVELSRDECKLFTVALLDALQDLLRANESGECSFCLEIPYARPKLVVTTA